LARWSHPGGSHSAAPPPALKATVVRLTLPAGRGLKKLPADRAREGDRSVLVVRRSVTVSTREIAPADYPKLLTFVSALGEEEAGAVTLAPVI